MYIPAAAGEGWERIKDSNSFKFGETHMSYIEDRVSKRTIIIGVIAIFLLAIGIFSGSAAAQDQHDGSNSLAVHGSTNAPVNTPRDGEGCVIPPSGPWPPCATGGDSGGDTGGSTDGDCVIPPSGPWPPCATGGGDSGGTTPDPTTPAPNPGNGGTFNPTAGGPTTFNVTNQVAVGGTQRFGVGLGRHDQFGARQILANIVPNPGFEPAEFGMIFLVYDSNPTATKVQSDNWLQSFNNEAFNIGQPAGFWDGAQFEVLSGSARGRTGVVTSYTFDAGRATFNLSGGNQVPDVGSVMAVRKGISGFDFNTLPNAKAAPGQIRPGSPGTQSLSLTPAANNQASFQEFFDTYGNSLDPSAGKLLLVDGEWNLNMWAKSDANSTLRVRFARGGNVFFEKSFGLNSGWTNIQETFTGNETLQGGGALALQMFVDGQVLIDDIRLARASYGNEAFSGALVDALRDMRPGVLRNWGDQLGSSLDNQLATEFGRKPTGYSPKDRIASGFHYSLHDFLRLSQQVGAEPYYVIPVTWTPAELQNFVAYLAAPAGSHRYADIRAQLGQNAPWTSVFSEIHIEYGNEIWGSNDNNDPYVGATFRGGIRAGEIASDRFNIMKASPFYNTQRMNFIIGGQSRFVGRQIELEANSSAHDSIGFAPYYGQLNTFSNNAEKYNPLWAHGSELGQRGFMRENVDTLATSGNNTRPMIYEINLDFAQHFVPGNVCNAFLTSEGAGISLPLVMLHHLQDLGIRDQVAFQLAQYSNSFRRCTGEAQRLFGMMRDIEATGRKRPTFLGIELVNKAMGGNLLVTNSTGPAFVQQPMNGVLEPTQVPYVQAFVFQQGNRYTAVLFNVDLGQARNFTLNVPRAGSQATMYEISAPLNANNETNVQVQISERQINNFSRSYSTTLQPHSMVVLEWTP